MFPSSEAEMRRVCISDSYNMTSNCLMDQELGVKFLKNPIIKVVKWRMIKDNNTKSLHIMEFITVKNTVNFSLLGNPTNLSSTTRPINSVENNGVLRPDRDLNNLVSNIMTAMTHHYRYS